MMRIELEVVGHDRMIQPDGQIEWVETGRYSNKYDLETQAFAQFVLNNVFGSAQTITDTGGTGRALSALSATSTYNIVAGTDTTAAAVTNTNLGAQSTTTSGVHTATIGAYSGSGTSGSFTLTATITNGSGSSITYGEVGIELTSATFVFLLARDVLSPTIPVSNTGTLAVTYTLTFQ